MPFLEKDYSYYDGIIKQAFENSTGLQTSLNTLCGGSITDHLGAAIWVSRQEEERVFASSGKTALGSSGKEITADTMFRIGSVTKTFGAAATLKLAAKGVFGERGIDESIHEHIEKWLTILEKKYDHIQNTQDFERILRNKTHQDATIRDILGHSSGIGDLHRNFYASAIGKRDVGFRYISYDADAPVAAKGKFAYSNTGYVLLGMILEAVTGKHQEQVIRDEILTPLKLSNTFSNIEYQGLSKEEKESRVGASSYYMSDSDGSLHKNFEMDSDGLAGNIVSSSKDLATFFRAVVTDPVFAEMFPKQTKGTGLGLFSTTWENRNWLFHSGGGGIGAAAAFVYICPETKETVIFNNTRVIGAEPATVDTLLNASHYQQRLEPEKTKVEAFLKHEFEKLFEEKGISLHVSDIDPDVGLQTNIKEEVYETLKPKRDTFLQQADSRQKIEPLGAYQQQQKKNTDRPIQRG